VKANIGAEKIIHVKITQPIRGEELAAAVEDVELGQTYDSNFTF
jgi:hypothetical protein